MNKELILASKSPRRLDILKNVGLNPIVSVSNVDEDIIDKSMAPVEYVKKLASLKSNAVINKFDKGLILGADTIVVLDDKILGQPQSKKDAENMLKSLSGRDHSVITGISIIDIESGREETEAVETFVRFKELSEYEILKYIDTGEPADKAGAYGIQGYGGLFVKKILGCYFNVVGLPIHMVYETLKKFEYEII